MALFECTIHCWFSHPVKLVEPSAAVPLMEEQPWQELQGMSGPEEVSPVENPTDACSRVVETTNESSSLTDHSEDAPRTEGVADEELVTGRPEVIFDDVSRERPLSPDDDGDIIYEDVHGDGPQGAGSGRSSSEFESYDEQSDTERKLPTRSKYSPDVRQLRERCGKTKREITMRFIS
ncbi:hypothetical protein DPEC_G00206760 [Dallia pectoralis]|uniref:Uncharacterized protein n=1 Tax=Dallia pectoralis TaxID=75939 RepID=A0ACC2G4E0_DALPE|nr:hypothetical protein DPEC_G00206760 [Dallia pectoralis]